MDGSLSNAVVQAVADADGVDETELEKPLADVIDPDALDRLFRDSTGSLSFRYLGYTVNVDHSGTVDVVAEEDG